MIPSLKKSVDIITKKKVKEESKSYGPKSFTERQGRADKRVKLIF